MDGEDTPDRLFAPSLSMVKDCSADHEEGKVPLCQQARNHNYDAPGVDCNGEQPRMRQATHLSMYFFSLPQSCSHAHHMTRLVGSSLHDRIKSVVAICCTFTMT